MKKYTIKGTGCQEYGKHIINFFEKLGGLNKHELLGSSIENLYYFIEYNKIKAEYVTPEDHTEIELLPNGMAKGVWYKDADDDYFKAKKIINNITIGDIIYYGGTDYYFDKDDTIIDDIDFTPLTDLTEIQEFLPDGHEDKYKPEPTDLIEPSTEYILKLIYEKWGKLCLINAIDCAISQNDNERLKGKDAEDKAENLINKWQPNPKIWKEDGIIMISTDAPEGAVEYTQERLNELLNINI
jgi:hypothetical protein